MDYKKAVEDKEREWTDLYTRMDEDKGLIYLDSYKMEDLNKRKVPNVINVTLNDPAVFAANVESSLGSAVEQITVETEDKKIDTAYIEDFLKAAFSSANALLAKQDRGPLNPFFDQQMCRRGRGAARCTFRMENGVLIPEIVPTDTRYFVYEFKEDGLAWTGFRTTKPKVWVEEKYKGVVVAGKEAKMLDIWTPDHFEIYVSDRKVYEEEHDYGYVPFGVQTVPLGSMLQDSDALTHRGESIFFLIRDLIPEMNRLASILQTLNMETIKNAMQWKTRTGEGERMPTHEQLTALGGMTAAEIGGGAEPIRIEDVRRAAQMLHSIIETRIQRGSLTSIDLGTLQFPLSAVALVELGEGRDQVFLPRLGSRGLLNQQIAEMIIEQVIPMGSVELGTKGHKRTFDTSKLRGEYEITFKYFIKSPKIDIARYSIANAADPELISQRTKRRDIIQMQDPDGEEAQLYWEQAGRESILVRRRRIIESLIKQGNDVEAELMSAELGLTAKQMIAGQMPQMPQEKRPRPESLLPLMAQGGPRRSAKKAAELEATPREETEE